MVTSDMISQSEKTVRTMVDLKVKLNRDKDTMEQTVEECKDKMVSLESNISILEKTNQQLE